jgi:hypothetical protein
MRQYLIEGITGAFPFIVDRNKTPVTESRPNGGSFTRIPGRFSVCDCVNGNNRRYSKRVWEKNLTEGSVLQESIKRNAAFGLLEHPKDGIVTLLSPISHHVTKAEMVETRDASGKPVYEVCGEIVIFNTDEGRKLTALIEGGYNPLVSSRGYGSLNKASDGVDEVAEDFVCEGWDVVIKPSFEQAELTPARSTSTATMATPVAPNPQAESKQPAPATVTETKQNLKESTPSTGADKPTSVTTNKNNTMELNTLKSQIESLRSADAAKPNRFAESMTKVEELHQQVAEWAAADPKRSWEAQKLHKSLDSIGEGLTATINRPADTARKLSENNNKLLRVIDAVAKTAVTYKKKLGEALKSDGSRVKMIEELTRRGQGWQRIAESRKQKLMVQEKDFDTACEALDIMAQRYHEDVTELGRRLIVLEFKEKAQTPEIQKSLKEATRLRHIVTIRERLEGKKKPVSETSAEGKQPKEGEQPSHEGIKDEKQKGAGSPDAGKVAEEPGKVKTESKAPGDAAKKTQTVSESQVLKTDRADISVRSVNESVELVRRLSTAPAK